MLRRGGQREGAPSRHVLAILGTQMSFPSKFWTSAGDLPGEGCGKRRNSQSAHSAFTVSNPPCQKLHLPYQWEVIANPLPEITSDRGSFEKVISMIDKRSTDLMKLMKLTEGDSSLIE